MADNRLEVWLRGPVPDVPPHLQPVAHALLQAREEVESLMDGFPDELLWERPAGLAPVGFHLRHLAGVVDRLFTYAHSESLTAEQLEALRSEGVPGDDPPRGAVLVRGFADQVDRAVATLRKVDPASLTQARSVGRAKAPSTVLGLLFHAAEHTQRHVGQLLVTTRILRTRA
jgi:hypothetical protein